MTRWLFALPPVLGAWALWAAAGDVGGWLALLEMTIVLAFIWPLVLLAFVAGLPYAAGRVVPREWRASYRARRPRQAQRSARLPQRLRAAVLAADRSRCAYCRSTWMLQIDHITPWAWGGLTSLPNLAVLCQPCNGIKRDYWVDRHGHAHGHSPDPKLAWQILGAEQRARWNPLRWWRAAWALV